MPARTERPRPIRRAAPLSVATLAMSAAALAQPADAPLLRGPDVENSPPPPGGGPMFSDSDGAADNARRERPVPHRLFVRAILSLQREAPEELRLSDEQKQELRAIERAWREEMRAFREEHAEELRAIRDRVGDERPGRRGPGALRAPGAERPDIDPDKLRALMQELKDLRPDPAETHAAQWEILTEDQQAFVEQRIETIRAEFLEKRQRKMIEKRFQDAPDPDARREQIRERLRNMSPEERREFMQRMRERRELNNSEPQPEEKPAPPVDDLDIPL